MAIDVVFAVGMENRVAVVDHPQCHAWNEKDINFLYDEIEKGCPLIQAKELEEGVYGGVLDAETGSFFTRISYRNVLPTVG